MAEFQKPMMPDFKGNPVTFIKDVKAELLKVTWPTRKEVVKLTIVVIAVSFVLGLYIGGLDLLFTKITDLLLRK